MVSSDNEHRTTISSAVSRRTALRGLGGAGMATALGLATPRSLLANEPNAATMIEPDAGTWKTWLLTAGDQLRPDAPPDEAATQDELTDLKAMMADRDAAALQRITYWDAGSPGYRWNELASQGTVRAGLDLVSYRLLALLNAAIYDATVAAWDAKYAYNRVRPAVADAALSTAIPTPNSPSYPDEHAVTAGAAAAVLSYVFPDEAEHYQTLAEEAADSRVMAGVAYPSDTAAGLTLGKQVGDLAVARGKTDGSDAQFDLATLPTGSRDVDRRPRQRSHYRHLEALAVGVGGPVPPRTTTGLGLPGASRRGRRGPGLRSRQRALHRVVVLAAGPGGTASTGLGPVHQQPGGPVLCAVPPLPVATGTGAEALRVPLGHQRPALGPRLRVGQHRHL